MNNSRPLNELVKSANTGLDAIKRAPIVEEDTGIKCARIQDISQKKTFHNWGNTKVEDRNFEKFKLLKDDFLIARTGASVGVNKLIDKDLKAVFNNGLIRIRCKEDLHPRFLYFCFQTPSYKGHINSIAYSTSTQPNMKIRDLLSIELPYFPLNEQKAIAHILGTLDDKIELNRKMNENLEEMAQALFKSWFVDFDPVLDKALAAGHEIPEPLQDNAEKRKALGDKRKVLPQEIADLFPDRFVFAEELGWIPEGWKSGQISHILNVVSDKVNPENFIENDIYVGLEHIDRKNLFLQKSGNISEVSSTKSKFKEFDVLFGKLRPYFHKVCIAQQNGICSTDILVFRPKNNSSHAYCLMNLYQAKLIEKVNMSSTGTRMPRASQKDILEYKIPSVPNEIIKLFEQLIFPFIKKGMQHTQDNYALSNLRDTVLAKLISGELRVPENLNYD